MGVRLWFWTVVALVVAWSGSCQGHGRLIEPPSRASAWRYGFDTPPDYNDNQGFCGGLSFQWEQMGGKCGICGDKWDANPRQHEAGGLYATGTIVRHYSEGQVINVQVEITANHLGHFEFRICPNNDVTVAASQTCLNEHPLPLNDGSGFYFNIGPNVGIYTVPLKLPAGLTCSQCVLQWRYVAGNNWGICEDGTGAVGCGNQEEFRACADVSISSSATPWTDTAAVNTGGDTTKTTQRQPTIPVTQRSTTPPPTQRPTTTTARSTQSGGSGGGSGGCRAVGVWQNVPGMDKWCVDNCNHVPPYCPASHCTCD